MRPAIKFPALRAEFFHLLSALVFFGGILLFATRDWLSTPPEMPSAQPQGATALLAGGFFLTMFYGVAAECCRLWWGYGVVVLGETLNVDVRLTPRQCVVCSPLEGIEDKALLIGIKCALKNPATGRPRAFRRFDDSAQSDTRDIRYHVRLYGLEGTQKTGIYHDVARNNEEFKRSKNFTSLGGCKITVPISQDFARYELSVSVENRGAIENLEVQLHLKVRAILPTSNFRRYREVKIHCATAHVM